jgi:hypothetical protein
MDKVLHFLETLQGSPTLCTTQQESHTPNKQITAEEYISAPEEIVKVIKLNLQHNGATAFKLSERSRVPPAFSAKDLSRG